MRIEIIIDDEAIVKKDCGCKAKKVIDLIDNLNEEEFEKVKFYLLQRESRAILTIEEKEAYVDIIGKLLGLPADATVDRITPAVVKMVDEFLAKIKDCVKQIKFGYELYSDLTSYLEALKLMQTTRSRNIILEHIKTRVKQIVEKEVDKVLEIACYAALKRKYAQEVQYLFFMGSKEIEK